MKKYFPFLVLLLVPSSSLAQFYPPYNNQQWCFDWSCYQQKPQKSTRTKHHTTKVREKPKAKTEEHTKTRRPEKPPRVKTVTVYRPSKPWQDLPQDDARQWIKDQVQSFCGKFPKDDACQKKEQ